MSLLTMASGQSVARGYDYYTRKMVRDYQQESETSYCAKVAGSGKKEYDVFIDVLHPRKSHCNCPHADGRRIICKHMIALYFTIFPKDAEEYRERCERERAEEEEWQYKMENAVMECISQMSREELERTLLAVLEEGPDWQYDRFIASYVDMDEYEDDEWEDDEEDELIKSLPPFDEGMYEDLVELFGEKWRRKLLTEGEVYDIIK